MKVLVTGATGFLGGALVRRLKSQHACVTALGRNPAALSRLENEGTHAFKADLADADAVRSACQGQNVVFHCGALSSAWGSTREFYNSNVLGTQNVIRACKDACVERLVYVSTPSIYFRFNSGMNVREDAPLPSRPANAYAHTKLLAEHQIDRAFGEGLPVITIRPRAIFGPGDTSILPRLMDRLSKNRLPVIGDGRTLTDLTYVENVVDALLLCAQSNRSTLGKKFNITNGEPVLLWEMVRKICTAFGYPYPHRQVSYWLADSAAVVLEWICRRMPGQPEPPLTRYTVSVVSKSTTLDISAARIELGYQPRVSIEAGFQEFVCTWKAMHP